MAVTAPYFPPDGAPASSAVDDAAASLPVGEVLERLGEKRPTWAPVGATSAEAITLGEALITTGRAPGAGPDVPRQSKYFTCTDCHNTGREDPDLRVDSPDARLPYVIEHGGALLQGDTFWGMANKTRWYNGHWRDHYGELVLAAHTDLRAAVQVCAAYCSQGRRFTEEELDGVMAWLWSRQIRLSDLDMDDALRRRIAAAAQAGKPNRDLAAKLKTFYLQVTPETAGPLPADLAKGYGGGDATIGELVFTTSCLHCHSGADDAPGPSFRDRDFTASIVVGTMTDDSFPEAFYPVLRHGTAQRGAYMPPFMVQRLSDKQIASLRAYLEALASDGP